MKNLFLSFAPILFLTTPSFAFTTNYEVMPAADGSFGINFAIGYTAGTHVGSATQVTGTVALQDNPFLISSTMITLPIAKISTGNIKRDCHLQESLGLDYTKSVYPKAQVCDNSDSLPASGPDSIAFPTITFNLTSLLNPTANDSLQPGVAKPITASGILDLHGVKKAITVPLTLTKNASDGTIKVEGEFDLSLTDYGIIVRKFLFVTVKDTAHLTLNLLLKEKP